MLAGLLIKTQKVEAYLEEVCNWSDCFKGYSLSFLFFFSFPPGQHRRSSSPTPGLLSGCSSYYKPRNNEPMTHGPNSLTLWNKEDISLCWFFSLSYFVTVTQSWLSWYTWMLCTARAELSNQDPQDWIFPVRPSAENVCHLCYKEDQAVQCGVHL